MNRLLVARQQLHYQQRRGFAVHRGSQFYQYVLKNNWTYMTFIFAGAFVVSGGYGAAVDAIWRSMNRGRLYDQIDWSKWKSNWKTAE